MKVLHALGTLWWASSIVTAAFAGWRTRGRLRYFLFASTALDCLFWWLRNHHAQYPTLYATLWPYSAGILAVLGGAVVLERAKTDRWPFYALAAACVHGWAYSYPNKFPGSYLQLEIHATAFICLLYGLLLLSGGTCRRTLPIAVLFLITAAAYYPLVWHMEARIPLLFGQAICYAIIAILSRPDHAATASTQSRPALR
jgi:hypothetical protein